MRNPRDLTPVARAMAGLPPAAKDVPPPPPPPRAPTGLTRDQEIRARAAAIAVACLSGRDAYNPGDAAVLDAAAATTGLAVHIEAYIRDGAPQLILGSEPGA
jgi:hypothetical protein